MSELFPGGEEDESLFDPELLNPEGLEEADRLSKEYHSFMRHRRSLHGNGNGSKENDRPIPELTVELRELFSWLIIEDPDSVTEQNVRQLKERYIDSAYDVEDIYFIVHDELKSRRMVRFADIVYEPQSTDLLRWRSRQTKRAAEFLVIHGVNENEINKWKSEEGSGRQQRAIRRMYRILNHPYMSQFANWLGQRAATEKPFDFEEMAANIHRLLIEQAAAHQQREAEKSTWIPRIQEEYESTTIWLRLALNICRNVFAKDIEDGIYK